MALNFFTSSTLYEANKRLGTYQIANLDLLSNGYDCPNRMSNIDENTSVNDVTPANCKSESDLVQLTKAMQDLHLDCNLGSCLIASIVKLLHNSLAILPMGCSDVPFRWPCPAMYNGETLSYNYVGHVFQMSAIQEKKEDIDASELTFYIIVNFHEDPLLYTVRVFRSGLIPKLTSTSVVDTHLYQLGLKDLDTYVVQPIADLCRSLKTNSITQAVLKKKEYNCVYGVLPVFYHQQKKKSGKQKTFKPDNNAVVFPNYYNNLKDAYQQMPTKPNGASRLLALIVKIFKCINQVGDLNPDVNWPIPIMYENVLVEITFCADKNSPKSDPNAFLFLLMQTSDAYFLVLKHKTTDHRAIHKLSSKLVPSYQKDEAFLDMERIDNLNGILRKINDNFVTKVPDSSFKPIKVSFLDSSGPPSVQ